MEYRVIFLHGLGEHPITLSLLKAYIQHKGFKNTYNLQYKVNTNTIQESVDEISDLLVDKYALNKSTDELIIIGQSMGGVIANNMHKNGWNIRLAIYIGSPLHGARLLTQVENLIPYYLHQLLYRLLHKPAYDILKNKSREEIPPHSYKTITMSWIFTRFDGCVYMDEAILDPIHNTHFRGADHRTIFANPRLWIKVYKLIIDEISQ